MVGVWCYVVLLSGLGRVGMLNSVLGRSLKRFGSRVGCVQGKECDLGEIKKYPEKTENRGKG